MGVLLNKARTLARDGVLSAREVGQIISGALEDGVLEVQQRKDLQQILTEMRDALTPEARKAVGSILGSTAFVPNLSSRVHGLSDADADRLEKAGVVWPSDILSRARTADGRADLANKAGVDEALVLKTAELIDLSRVKGLGVAYSAALHRVGVANVQTLASSDATTLRRALSEFLLTAEGKKIAKRRPTLDKVEGWIAAAKQLPLALRYPGATTSSFSLAAFKALPKDDQAQLMFGYDVTRRDGTVYQASDLTLDTAQRRPRAITDVIKSLEESKLDGEYESVSCSHVERVKVGDTVIGFRLVFDVSSGEPEGEVLDPGEAVGTVEIAVDEHGAVLGQNFDNVYSEPQGE